jgi:DNA-binding FadR family transcriptional regulator
MGARARARVLDHFLSPRQLSETMHVLSELASPPRRAARGCPTADVLACAIREHAIEHHRNVLTAIRARDPEQARWAMHGHLR